MNTKEAIEFCKNQQNYNYNGHDEKIQRALRIFNYGLEEVISLLQQGEAYEAMWGELEKKFKILHKDYETGEEYYTGVINESDIKELKQKYFPKDK